MTAVVVLLLVNGALGALDTLWYHERTARLPARPDLYRTELRLHASRDAVYALLYGTIGWWAWEGGWAVLLCGLLVVEIGITLGDFVVEDRTRGLRPGERVLHSVMAIIYGAMLMRLVPLLIERAQQPASLVGGDTGVPPSLAAVASLLGLGIVLSGARDAWAARPRQSLALPGSAGLR